MRGNSQNLIDLYEQSDAIERQTGMAYYDRQRERLAAWADGGRLPLRAVIGAFVALSPNTSEAQNYKSLDRCIKIVNGQLPPESKIVGYPLNRQKALYILRGAEPEIILGGLKVRAFFFNTLDPDDSRQVTVDGHMLGAWCKTRLVLRRNAQIHGKREYAAIVEDFQKASSCYNIPAPRFQAILWLAWKRINRILYTSQLKFDWGDLMPSSPIFSPSADGPSTPKGISSTPAGELIRGYGAESPAIG